MQKDSNELSDKTDQLQMRINRLKVSKCTVEENLLSSSQSSSCGKSNQSPQYEFVWVTAKIQAPALEGVGS